MANRGATQWQWPLWGVAAGVFGYFGHLITDDNPTGSSENRLTVEEVVASLDREQVPHRRRRRNAGRLLPARLRCRLAALGKPGSGEQPGRFGRLARDDRQCRGHDPWLRFQGRARGLLAWRHGRRDAHRPGTLLTLHVHRFRSVHGLVRRRDGCRRDGLALPAGAASPDLDRHPERHLRGRAVRIPGRHRSPGFPGRSSIPSGSS